MEEEKFKSLEVLISKELYERLIQTVAEWRGPRKKGRKRDSIYSITSMFVENALREYLDKPESYTVAAEK